LSQLGDSAGSIPWVVIMLILVILFPGMVDLSIKIFGCF
jgi:hypothetical protein